MPVSEQVEFQQLLLVIVDEQHRFGVHQRLALREKGAQDGIYPHRLIMTATPIPRTLADDRVCRSRHLIIDELPPGRTRSPPSPYPIPAAKCDRAGSKPCLEGRQAYWVCTLIEESEVLECQAAENTAEESCSICYRNCIGFSTWPHETSRKTAVMQEFKEGILHLLVATTVIEVGVDVPNASLMIIENPNGWV